MPKVLLGKLSVIFIILVPLFFLFGFSMVDTLYENVSSGDTIIEDVKNRPVLTISMLTGMALGVTAFIVGLIAIIKKQEKSWLVYISTVLGGLFTLYLIAEIAFPH